MHANDDFLEVDPGDFEVAELRAIIRGTASDARLPAMIAVGVLRRKLGTAAIDELEVLAGDETVASRLRRAAIIELTQLDRTDVPRRLEPMLRDAEPAIARAALVGLGRRGDGATLELLRYRKLPEQLVPVRDLTSLLIAARTGAPPPPPQGRHVPRHVLLGRKAALDIKVLRPPAKRVSEVIDHLSNLSLPLVEAGSMEFHCANQRLMFVPITSDIVADRATDPAVVGVVARLDVEESQRWMPGLYVLFDGRDNGGRNKGHWMQVQVWSVGGHVVYSGDVNLDTGGFSVAAEDRPGVVPVEVTGTYQAGELKFKKARSGERTRGALTPQLL
jgi:hypothetical protein